MQIKRVALPLVVLLFAFGSRLGIAGTITWTTFDYPGADATAIQGISSNDVVGWYNIGGNQHGFLYNGATWTTFDDPSAPAPTADGSGTFVTGFSGGNVVGYYYAPFTSPNYFAFLYNGTTWTALAPPHDSGATYATGISGNIVVGYDPASSFLYNMGTSSYSTFNYPGANETRAEGIDGEVVVGTYVESAKNYGFLYNITTEQWTALPTDPAAFPGDISFQGISGNDVVGSYTDSNAVGHGFLYNLTTETWTTLDDPLEISNSDGEIEPNGVEGNTIVGYYVSTTGYANGFLAVVPEPSSLLLAVLGGASFAILAERRRRNRFQAN
jgi:hypothetical protein